MSKRRQQLLSWHCVPSFENWHKHCCTKSIEVMCFDGWNNRLYSADQYINIKFSFSWIFRWLKSVEWLWVVPTPSKQDDALRQKSNMLLAYLCCWTALILTGHGLNLCDCCVRKNAKTTVPFRFKTVENRLSLPKNSFLRAFSSQSQATQFSAKNFIFGF